MITVTLAKLIHVLPESWVTFLSKKVVNSFLKKYANIKCVGSENLKGIQTPTIFVCNHLSNADGLILDKVLKAIDPTFVAGVKLNDNAITRIGVNVIKTTHIKPESPDKEGLMKIVNLVKHGESLLIFPEGTRSRTGCMIEAKKGILLIAKMTGAPIVPIGLYGTEALLPIHPEGDMGSEKFNHAQVHVKIGTQFEMPVREKNQDKSEYETYAMEYVMHQIAALLPEAYRGIYS